MLNLGNNKKKKKKEKNSEEIFYSDFDDGTTMT